MNEDSISFHLTQIKNMNRFNQMSLGENIFFEKEDFAILENFKHNY
jgi:hypothetical protein